MPPVSPSLKEAAHCREPREHGERGDLAPGAGLASLAGSFAGLQDTARHDEAEKILHHPCIEREVRPAQPSTRKEGLLWGSGSFAPSWWPNEMRHPGPRKGISRMLLLELLEL